MSPTFSVSMGREIVVVPEAKYLEEIVLVIILLRSREEKRTLHMKAGGRVMEIIRKLRLR
jgi:hypothetical protein